MAREPGLAVNSAIISGFTGMGMLAGFGIDILIAVRFGVGWVTDAYFAAITIPVVLFGVILGSSQGVLVASLAHDLSLSEEDDQAEGRGVRLFSTLLLLALLVGLFIALLGSWGAGLLMRLLAPGFDQTTWGTAVLLSQVLFWQVPAALVAAIGRAGLYASRHFASAATANFLPSAFALTAMLLHPAGDIRWVALVIVLGYWLALGWLVAALAVSGANPYRRWYRYIPEAVRFWRNPAVRQIGRDLTAPMLGLLSRQGVVLAERWFGSFLPPGSVSALGYANKITTVLAGVVFDSLTTAGLPGLTRALSQRLSGVATREWRRLLGFCLGSALPLGIGLALVSRPLLVFLFARSGSAQLDTATALQLASVMAVYFLGLIPLGLFRAQQSYLYAVQRPAWVAVLLFLATLVTLLLDWPLVRLLDAAGLALSFSAGMIVASLFAFGLIRRYRIPA